MVPLHTPQLYNVCLYDCAGWGGRPVSRAVRAVPPPSARIDFGVGSAAPPPLNFRTTRSRFFFGPIRSDYQTN